MYAIRHMTKEGNDFRPARDFLSRARCLEAEIESKIRQLKNMRELSLSIRSFLRDEPVVSHSAGNPLENSVVRIVDAEAELDRQVHELLKVREEILKVLEQVPEQECRLALEKKYLEYENYDQIGEDCRCSRRWAICLHKRGLELVQRILERNACTA